MGYKVGSISKVGWNKISMYLTVYDYVPTKQNMCVIK